MSAELCDLSSGARACVPWASPGRQALSQGFPFACMPHPLEAVPRLPSLALSPSALPDTADLTQLISHTSLAPGWQVARATPTALSATPMALQNMTILVILQVCVNERSSPPHARSPSRRFSVSRARARGARPRRDGASAREIGADGREPTDLRPQRGGFFFWRGVFLLGIFFFYFLVLLGQYTRKLREYRR